MFSNRFPLSFRVLMFVVGLAALGLVLWGHAAPETFHLLTQITVTLLGASVMSLAVAFWPREEKAWNHRLVLIGIATFAAGVTWISATFEGSLMSIPGFLMVCSIAYGIAVLFTHRRMFEPDYC
ncbi:MAG: hypothetical protein AAB794_01775 [Patescibacteria group bacterium]